MPELHDVTVAREGFAYRPVVEVPAWWPDGQLTHARRGELITVNDDDYQRGRKFGSFEGEPPLPTRRVTIRHSAFEYVPAPFPSRQPEFWRRTATRGETVDVIDEDFERGVKHSAFEGSQPPAPYGRAGEPPLYGSAIDWLNWANTVEAEGDTEPFRLLADDLDKRASDDAQQRRRAQEVRRLLLEGDRTAWTNITNRVHDLVSAMLTSPANAAKRQLVDAVMSGQITDPDSVQQILAGL